MIADYYPIRIVNNSSSTNGITIQGTIETQEKKEGYDKKVTLYGKKIISYLTVGSYITINILYIEESDLNILNTLWKNNTIIKIYDDSGKVYTGLIVNEDFNFTRSLNAIDTIYYYSGTINVEA